MSAKTGKRWVILTAVLSLLVGIGYFVHQLQIKRLARSVAEQADSAAKSGDFGKAEKLYWEHLVNVPDDVEIQIKYADMLLKEDSSPRRQFEALQIYGGILRQNPGREDVRRRRMELKIAMGQLIDEGAEADLKILLNKEENKNDGNLLFWMGRCYEEGKNDAKAVESYQKAIEHDVPQRIEAYQRLATLFRDRLNQPIDADQAIEAMVQSAPKNYLVYLERGRYRRRFGLPDSGADFQKALDLAAGEPDASLEMAKTAENEARSGAAREILKAGLKKTPTSAALYEALASMELRSHHTDKAVEILERGLQSSAEKSGLRWLLAYILAQRGDTAKLLLQIEELKNVAYADVIVQFLTAYYHVNCNDFRKARQLLVPLASQPGMRADFKARVNDLLARCYSQMGEPEMQQEAYLRALSANPQDVVAKQGLIAHKIAQGEIEGAIKEYRALVKQAPGVMVPLAQLLIRWNRQRPASQRDWSEVKSLIDDAEKTSPESIDIAIVRAALYEAQDKPAEARSELEQARSRFPKSVAIWCALANLMGTQNQFNEAQSLLAQAQERLGDRVELRLQRARLSLLKGGPQVVSDLNDLSQNIEPFSKDDRRKLMIGLASGLRLQDKQGASRLFSRLAEQEPNNLEIRLALFELQLETGNGDEIEKNIKQIQQIEGNDGLLGHFCQVPYLIWQAKRAMDKDPKEAMRLRTKARVVLNELASRRSDWSVIPLALAELQELELAQPGMTEDKIQAMEESLLRYYRRAIDLGQRSPVVVKRTVKLLFKNKRGSEALDLLNNIPVESQLTRDLGRQASEFAIDNRDFQRAEAIARKMVTAHPGDFQERLWLVHILVKSGRQAEAETEIRQAIDLSKSDPDRWITLVQFMVFTKQLEKAARAIEEAEATLPPSQAPLALAQCCELVGKAYEGSGDAETKQWYAKAKGWYEKAQAAHPNDISITRRLTEFFRQTNQMAEAEAHLAAILKPGSNLQSTETVAWARRTLALTLASSADPQQVRRALSILEPASQTAAGDKGATALEDPEDLRVLARVLSAQKTIQHSKRAIDVLESLLSRNLARTEDRFLLARLHEISGNWPKAREEYRELNLRTKNARDLETLNRRPLYLAQFASSLLRNPKAGNEQDLTDAQDLVDELKQLQRDGLDALALQVEIYRARNQPDKAVDLIQTTSKRSNLAPMEIRGLAELAEKLDRFDVADQLYRQYAGLPNSQNGKIVLALFLGRHGHVKDALDVCEPLWANPRNAEAVAFTCIQIVIVSNHSSDPVQVERVAGWLEQAIKQKKDSIILLVNLANCRERQERYDEAKALYQSIINQVTHNAAAPSGNSIIANSYNNLAWLLALKDGQAKDALVDINHAIELVGHLPDYLDTRGVIYLGLKETKLAINDLESAVKADPSPSKLFHLAQAYLQANNKEKAKQYLKEAKHKGLDDDKKRFGPGGLHPLERSAYQELNTRIGIA